MRYTGNKSRIAKHILPIILKDRKPKQWYVEPFVGGANMIDKVEGFRLGSDYNEHLIKFFKALQDGWCTIQFNSFLAGKITTQKMKGGNTDEFYAKEGTINKSQMLKDMHPDLTKVVWKFNRWHHQVDYSGFKQKLKATVNLNDFTKINNYGMKIVKTIEDKTNNYKSTLEKKYKTLLESYKNPTLTEYFVSKPKKIKSIQTDIFNFSEFE